MNNQNLKKAGDAASLLGVSKMFLYRLPKEVPGVYRFGRAVRYDVEELRAWAGSTGAGNEQTVKS